MSDKVLVVNKLTDKQKDELESGLGSFDFRYHHLNEVSEEEINEADIIIGNVKPSMLGKNANNLKWLQLFSAGFEPYLSNDVLSDSTILTNASGAYNVTVSEHAIALTLTVMRRLQSYAAAQEESHWAKSQGSIQAIYKSNFVVVGTGNIGDAIAKIAKGFGAYTVGVSTHPERDYPNFGKVVSLDETDKVLADADVVVLSIPGSEKNHHFIDATRLAKMKNSAVLINIGRGNLVDLEALCDEIEDGKLFGAGIDVTEPEPLPDNHRAWKVPNLVITPHVAGGFELEQTVESLVTLAHDNLRAYEQGKRLKNVVRRIN